jgi:hypothetical protein
MYSQCLIYFILIILINGNQLNKSIVLHIGGLFNFEHSSVDHGPKDLQAAQMAIEEINNRRNDLFNGTYVLKLLSNNSRVDKQICLDVHN